MRDLFAILVLSVVMAGAMKIASIPIAYESNYIAAHVDAGLQTR